MFTFKAEHWVPKFLLNDKNGYACAKAIEAAMQSMNDIVLQGIKCINDYDTMPEWRLDELAWETNCLYDYTADVACKREWIKNAVEYYAKYGTPDAIVKYLSGIFDNVVVEEPQDYGGDPFHFRVIVTGEWSDAADDWAKKAVAATKNVRSVLDTITFNAGSVTIPLYVAAAACGVEIECDALMM